MASKAPRGMNKAELVELVQKTGEYPSKAAAERALTAVVQSIERGLKKAKKVTIVDFGTFRVASRKARDIFNLKTRKMMKAPGYRTVTFRCGKGLKASV